MPFSQPQSPPSFEDVADIQAFITPTPAPAPAPTTATVEVEARPRQTTRASSRTMQP